MCLLRKKVGLYYITSPEKSRGRIPALILMNKEKTFVVINDL